jgi:hypothetical protein
VDCPHNNFVVKSAGFLEKSMAKSAKVILNWAGVGIRTEACRSFVGGVRFSPSDMHRIQASIIPLLKKMAEGGSLKIKWRESLKNKWPGHEYDLAGSVSRTK